MIDLLGIVGSVSQPSKTRAAVELALRAGEEAFDITTAILHLSEYRLSAADGRSLHDYEADTADAVQLIIDSKAFIMGTPVYRGACSGTLKNLLDMIPRGKWQSKEAPLESRAVGLLATGASQHHFLSISQELEPLLNFFGAYTVSSGVYVVSRDFQEYTITNPEVVRRLELLGKATVELSNAIEKSSYLRQLSPQF